MNTYGTHFTIDGIDRFFDGDGNITPATKSSHSEFVTSYEEAAEKQKQGDLKAAIVNYAAALRHRPDHFNALFNMGLCLNKEGDIEQAIEAFKAASRLKPDHKPTLLHLSSLFIEKGDKDESTSYWARYQAV
jgi:tetratricopeptide (TPR) repeat protein